MKAFFIILIICAVMLGGIIHNSIYVRNFAYNAQMKLSSIEFDNTEKVTEQLSEFSFYAKRGLKRIEFSTPHAKSDLILDYLDLLEIHIANNDKGEFEKTQILLTNLLREIGELEELSLTNIL